MDTSFSNNWWIKLFRQTKQKLKTVDYYTDSKPGIVIAANNFFIINRETEKI